MRLHVSLSLWDICEVVKEMTVTEILEYKISQATTHDATQSGIITETCIKTQRQHEEGENYLYLPC